MKGHQGGSPEADTCLAYLRNSTKAKMAEAWWIRGARRENEVREDGKGRS